MKARTAGLASQRARTAEHRCADSDGTRCSSRAKSRRNDGEAAWEEATTPMAFELATMRLTMGK
jgi:hypothetical protein